MEYRKISMGNIIHFSYSQGYNVSTPGVFLYPFCLVIEVTASAHQIRGLGRYLESKALCQKCRVMGGILFPRVIFFVMPNNCIITYQFKVYYIFGSVYFHLQLLLCLLILLFPPQKPHSHIQVCFVLWPKDFYHGCMCDYEFTTA